MSENKTRPTNQPVIEFLARVKNARRQEDAFKLLEMMEEETGEKAVMWGPSIVGFGECHYKYPSGREGDMPLAGFSPRSTNLVVYCNPGFDELKDDLRKLGTYTTGAVCLYIKKLQDVDEAILRKLIKRSYEMTKEEWS
jgi:hypothetical protein